MIGGRFPGGLRPCFCYAGLGICPLFQIKFFSSTVLLGRKWPNVSAPSNWILTFPKSIYQVCTRETCYAPRKIGSYFGKISLFLPVVGEIGGVSTKFRAIRRILGVIGPILDQFRRKSGSHFYGLRPSKMILVSRVWEFSHGFV